MSEGWNALADYGDTPGVAWQDLFTQLSLMRPRGDPPTLVWSIKQVLQAIYAHLSTTEVIAAQRALVACQLNNRAKSPWAVGLSLYSRAALSLGLPNWAPEELLDWTTEHWRRADLNSAHESVTLIQRAEEVMGFMMPAGKEAMTLMVQQQREKLALQRRFSSYLTIVQDCWITSFLASLTLQQATTIRSTVLAKVVRDRRAASAELDSKLGGTPHRRHAMPLRYHSMAIPSLPPMMPMSLPSMTGGGWSVRVSRPKRITHPSRSFLAFAPASQMTYNQTGDSKTIVVNPHKVLARKATTSGFNLASDAYTGSYSPA
jgi:hypothetical protein